MGQAVGLLTLLSITFCADSLVLVSLLWLLLEKGGSGGSLATLCLFVSLVPYLVQKFSTRLTAQLEKRPEVVFSWARTAGLIFSVFSFCFATRFNLVAIYIFASLFSIITFLTNQSLETLLSLQVIRGKISANEASRLLQTALQVGAFLGGCASGYLMDWGGFRTVSVALAITFALGGLGIRSVLQKDKRTRQNREEKTTAVPAAEGSWNKVHPAFLWSAFWIIGLVLVQVSAFNILVPYLTHQERGWRASDYGLIDGFAGLGALLAALYLRTDRVFRGIIIVSALMLAVADWMLGTAQTVWIAALAALLSGIFMNVMRVRQRELIFHSVKNAKDAVNWAGLLSIGNLMIRSVATVVLGLVLQTTGASQSFVILAVFIVIATVVLQAIQSHHATSASEEPPELPALAVEGK